MYTEVFYTFLPLYSIFQIFLLEKPVCRGLNVIVLEDFSGSMLRWPL